MVNNENWLGNSRRQNRAESFRQQSAVQFRNLEMLYLREIEKDAVKRQDLSLTFDNVIRLLNDFLPAIRMVRSDRVFSITDLEGTKTGEESISSGESEFIAQAIELLVFSRSEMGGKILLLDEPDVHLHPDLQTRFVQLIEKVAVEKDMEVVIATPSTAILSGLSDGADLQVVPVSNRSQQEFEGFPRAKVSDELLPIFGAHPLSTVFNQSPIVLVEGEDDYRVIEQAVRSSKGRVRLKPCAVGTVDEMGRAESWLGTFLPVLYDNAVAYSLRDLDSGQGPEINDVGLVKRARLNCYAMENILLSDESFHAAGTTSDQVFDRLARWLDGWPDHPHAANVRTLIENFSRRRVINIKDVRNIVLMVLGVTKPWEVHVGQVLASDTWFEGTGDHSLATYLGDKAGRLFH